MWVHHPRAPRHCPGAGILHDGWGNCGFSEVRFFFLRQEKPFLRNRMIISGWNIQHSFCTDVNSLKIQRMINVAAVVAVASRLELAATWTVCCPLSTGKIIQPHRVLVIYLGSNPTPTLPKCRIVTHQDDDLQTLLGAGIPKLKFLFFPRLHPGLSGFFDPRHTNQNEFFEPLLSFGAYSENPRDEVKTPQFFFWKICIRKIPCSWKKQPEERNCLKIQSRKTQICIK